jgi:hypothetical protein
LLIGNHYFSPDTVPGVITDYFHFLENTLDTKHFRVILLGDFNAPGFNWGLGSPLPNYHYYSKIKGDDIYTSACLLGLRQFVVAVHSPIWGLRLDFYYCQAFAGLLMWNALSDERTGLSFARITVSSNKPVVSMYNLHVTCY